MQDKDVDKQIRQMVDFIKLEAQEKANEIRMKTKADADLEKQMAVLNAKNKLTEEYERKEKALAVDARIKASMEERSQRSRLLAARDEFVQKLGVEAKARLTQAAASGSVNYDSLLRGLIKQGLFRLEGESDVVVRVRPKDVQIAQREAVAAAREVEAEEAKAAEGVAPRKITITVEASQSLASSAGGVVLAAQSGKILCDNTLEERLTLALQDLQPVIRDLVFPSARAEVRVKPKVNIHAGHAPSAPVPVPVPVPAKAAPTPAAAAGTSAADPFAFPAPAAAAPAADPFSF